MCVCVCVCVCVCFFVLFCFYTFCFSFILLQPLSRIMCRSNLFTPDLQDENLPQTCNFEIEKVFVPIIPAGVNTTSFLRHMPAGMNQELIDTQASNGNFTVRYYLKASCS